MEKKGVISVNLNIDEIDLEERKELLVASGAIIDSVGKEIKKLSKEIEETNKKLRLLL